MAYRRLARQLHPDVNADNRAQEQFIRVTEAYKTLVKMAAARPAKATPSTPPSPPTSQSPSAPAPQAKSVRTPQPQPTATASRPPQPDPPAAENGSFADQKLKLETYRQLSDLIKRRSLPRAIATVEALQARLPNDPEIRQWQALIYQRWGRQLIEERKLNQARAYLKKALKTDPHNRALWTEIEQDFKRIENTY